MRESRQVTTAESCRILAAVYGNIRGMRSLRRDPRLTKAAGERIMLAVTQVNGCRMCSYAHTRMALEEGIGQESISDLLSGDLSSAPEEEMKALLFAQHYAESGGRPSPDAVRALISQYGHETSKQILSYIRIIMVGNAYGNTLGHLKDRFSGRPAVHSSLFREISVLLCILPLNLILALWALLKLLLPPYADDSDPLLDAQ